MSAFSESGKLKAVTFSFDDGVTQDIRLIELLNKYGLKATFNINSGLLGGKGMLIREGKRISHYKIHPTDVRAVYDGHEIAAHTLTHPHLPPLEESEIIRQVEEDRCRLSELAGYEVVGMAYPGGGVNNDERVAEIVKEKTGILYSRTITLTNSMDRQENLFRFDPTAHYVNFGRMEDYVTRLFADKSGKEQILYIWGHSYEMDYAPDYWIRLEKFFELVSGREEIFYGTNKEIILP